LTKKSVSNLNFLLVFFDQLRIHLHLGRLKGYGGYKLQVRIAAEFASQPKEGLLEVVVALCTYVIVLPFVM
jgi:hypothetical protein